MFRVTNRGKEIGNAESIEDVRRIVEGQPAGRYDVDERPSDRFPDGDKWLAWGHLIRHADRPLEEDRWTRSWGPLPRQHPLR